MLSRSSGRFWIIVVLLSVVPAAMAQLGATQDSSASNKDAKYSVKGAVVNSATGEPVPRALVQLYAVPPKSVLTDADGQFEFDDLPAMTASVMARKPGYFTQQEITPSALSTVTVGPDTPTLTVPLIPEGVIFGQVKEANGEPIEGLPISVIYVHVVNGHKRWEHRGGAATDDEGRFRIADLFPGTYYLSAGPSWARMLRRNWRLQTLQEGYSQLYFPAALDLSAASPIQIAPGQQFEADFSLQAQRAFHLAGVVTGAAPGQGVQVNVLSGDEMQRSFGVRSGPADQFEATLPAGNYTIRAATEGDNGAMRAYVPITLKSDLTGLRVALLPASTISAMVTLDGTQANQPAQSVGTISTGRYSRVSERNISYASVHLRRTGTLFEGQDLWLDAGTAPRDSQEITPGKYSVEITPNSGDWYVQSAESGGRDLLREDLTVAPGTQPAPIQIVLRNDGATLTGSVSSDPQAGTGSGTGLAVPVVIVSDRDPAHPKSILSASNGHFQFSDVPPGNVSVLAFDPGTNLEYANPDVLAQYLSQATRLTLSPNQQSTTTVSVIHVEKQ